MQFMNSELNNIQNEWFNSCANVNSLGIAKKIINSFKYKYEALSWTIYVFIYINKCNMQCLNSGFNKFQEGWWGHWHVSSNVHPNINGKFL
jgi:hypothetical protein